MTVTAFDPYHLRWVDVTNEAQRNKAVIHRLLDAADRGDLDGVAACYAPDYVDHALGGSRETADRAGALAAFSELAHAFLDVRHTIHELIAEGDKVVLRVSATGTHGAPLRGIPASGRSISSTQTAIYRLRDGLVVERWRDSVDSVVDRLRCPEHPATTAGAAGAGARVLRGTGVVWRDDVAGASYWELGLTKAALSCFRLAPGTRFATHAHDAEQITLVLEGRLIFEVRDERFALDIGDAIAIPGGVPHAVEAGDAPVLAIDAWSPPPGHLGST